MPCYVGAGDQEYPRKDNLRNVVDYCRLQFEKAELAAALHRIDQPFRLALARNAISYQETMNQVSALLVAVDGELAYRRFAYVPTDKAKVLDGYSLDWAAVNEQFPKASLDVMSAIECYALDLNTACVFHLMRVAEHGLRALARERRVKLPRNKALEWAQWNEVIKAIEKTADDLLNKPAGQRRNSALQFYRGACGEFEAFKDIYRNDVMHSRTSYNAVEAASATLKVRDFMLRLASKINENGRRLPTGWR